jgi:hypothetical protein
VSRLQHRFEAAWRKLERRAILGIFHTREIAISGVFAAAC